MLVFVSGMYFFPLMLHAQAPQALSDDTVIERLSPRPLKQDPATYAQRAIELSRITGDPRHLGRAQAALKPWWNKADAPANIAVLQATVLQARHEFSQAREWLLKTTARHPHDAQAWLTLASIEKTTGNYAQAKKACEKTRASGQAAYADLCKLELDSLQGGADASLRDLQALATTSKDRQVQALAYSLMAEHHERSSAPQKAFFAFQLSLGIAPDAYTAIAFSDALLRSPSIEHARQALAVLQNLNDSDAVLVRKYIALKQLGDVQWTPLSESLGKRLQTTQAFASRTDPGHDRELAMYLLELANQPKPALAAAMRNLEIQREPIDFLLAVKAAKASGDTAALAKLAELKTKQGLVDAR